MKKSKNPNSKFQIQNLAYAWDHFWLRSSPPHSLALLRIALGAFLLFYVCITFLPHVEMLFSNQGLRLPLYDPPPSASFAFLFKHPDPWIAWSLFGLLLLGLIGFTIGYAFRISTLIVILVGLFFWQLNLHHFHTSYLRIFLLVMTVFFFSGADRTLSLRMKLKKGSWLAWEPICILPLRLIAIQITFTYFGVGWQKAILPDWQGGEILPYSFAGRWGTGLAHWMLQWNLPMWFYDYSVKTVSYFEYAIPFGLWIRRYYIQWWFFAGSAIFHILISSMLAIWWFLFLIPACVVFLTPEEVKEWVEHRFLRR